MAEKKYGMTECSVRVLWCYRKIWCNRALKQHFTCTGCGSLQNFCWILRDKVVTPSSLLTASIGSILLDLIGTPTRLAVFGRLCCWKQSYRVSGVFTSMSGKVMFYKECSGFDYYTHRLSKQMRLLLCEIIHCVSLQDPLCTWLNKEGEKTQRIIWKKKQT